MRFINYAFDLIFPPSCGICQKINKKYICDNCYKEIQKYEFQNNYKRNKIHLLKYEGIVREKMIAYKFNDKSYLYKMFCEIFMKNKKACEFLKSYDIIIPVPMHNKRKKIRGYNQSELIAKELTSKLGVPTYTNILKKQINTPSQSTLGKYDRIKNVNNVYELKNETIILNKKVLILDDIYTTGATVNECKKMLTKANASKIGIITISKDLMKGEENKWKI